MFFSLDVMRARKGDCLMVHYGKADDPRLIMIDGGPRQVYGLHLKPRILQLRQARGLKPQEPLVVDLLMVSHLDDDHIQGILDLTKELITGQMEHKPPLLDVLSFWHNGFEKIIGHSPDELTAAFKQQFGAASMGGDLPAELTIPPGKTTSDDATIVSALKVLASIEQGDRLRDDANRLRFPLNPEFDGKLIIARKTNESIEIADGLRFTVVGPMLPEIKMLHAKHQAWLRELRKKGELQEGALAAYVDRSVPNLSSIVVLAEADDRSMLLTGDARGDKILLGLEFVGRMEKRGKMHVNLLKVPHHGSSHNLDHDFFRRITADHYVFSGNGEHGNPDRESLQMLLDERGDEDYTIHLTYPIDELDKARKADWEKEQRSEKKRKEKNPNLEVRPGWMPKKHGLVEFFKQHKALAKKISIVEDRQSHVINLQDELAFPQPL